MSAGDVADEVRRLETLKLEDLRAEWRRRYGTAPKLRSADLLRRNLAWRMQAERYGGLDPALQKLVFQKRGALGAPELRTDMRLAREWKGMRHEVEITETGVLYRGETFASLSQVARRITGVRWNGPRFFGLRDVEARTR